jgi:lysozyme
MADPAPSSAKRKTLIGILGAAAAIGAVVNVAKEESGRTVTAAPTADGHVAIRHVSGPQYLNAYQDVIGVWTACDGIAYVKANAKFTEAQCSAMLEAALVDTADHVMACTPGLAGAGHDNQRIAAVLLAHNIGWPAFCRSTARARFNARQYAGACDAFLLWNKAGGRVVNGLVERRKRERLICLKDVGRAA